MEISAVAYLRYNERFRFSDPSEIIRTLKLYVEFKEPGGLFKTCLSETLLTNVISIIREKDEKSDEFYNRVHLCLDDISLLEWKATSMVKSYFKSKQNSAKKINERIKNIGELSVKVTITER
ncbi:hypothetical protein NDS46_31580 (plasmid) [Paenibacillus thiaminolyticus]|uniref:hypothetical protein n=1 Tax=Paenibacillus thiaminolyticus TaxID=49283 RepID=UPI00232E25FC|nr:hypothetical protein [Paenibacillus thiaminolyticus]WCF11500.1 hypothetical protein NDS46_31580 [Paenibacillus thiaminolyticus]